MQDNNKPPVCDRKDEELSCVTHDEGCGCLDKLQKKLDAHHGTHVDLQLKLYISGDLSRMGAALPPLYYKYKQGKKVKTSYVAFNYCPFCGKKVVL